MDAVLIGLGALGVFLAALAWIRARRKPRSKWLDLAIRDEGKP